MNLIHKLKTCIMMNWTFRLLMFLVFVIVFSLPSCEKPERYVKLEALEIPDEDISYTYAILKGEIIDVGSIPLSDHGIVISESGTPVLGISQGLHLGQAVKKGVFQDTIKNLKKNTLYYFRVFVIVNGEEKYSQKTPKFKTKDTKEPTVTAGTIAGITMTSASLTGEVTSDGGEPETVRGLCWGASPNPTISTSIDTTVNGTGKGSFTVTITGLNPGTSYYVRTYATNSKGTAYNSADIVFKTHNLPKVTTAAVTAITNTGATSGGDVTDDGDTEVTVRGVCWGTAPLPTIELTTKTTDGSGKGTFVSAITGLTPLTTFYLRAYATNKYGTSYGTEVSFTATKPPTALTKAATLIGNTTATLNANINAHSFSSIVTFEYGATTTYGSTVSATTSPVSGTTATDVLANVTLLSPGTTYHFRVKAVSEGGISYGEDLIFTTLQPPSATTNAASDLTTTTATLNGIVNANNSSTSVTFEYGPTTEYGSLVAATPSPVTGNTPTNVTAALTGLNEGTIYHYRIRAISDGGTAYGDDMIITSLSPPVATTTAATSVTGTTATLNGTVNAKDQSTIVEFEYGTSTSYGTTVTATQSPITGNTSTIISAALTGLLQGTTYHFRVKATSSAGTTLGNDLTFTTLNVPSITTASITSVTSSSASGGGNITSDGGSAITALGVCWSTITNPTVDLTTKTSDGATTGSFVSSITGLNANTTNYVRAYATNSVGTAYGNEMNFTTLCGSNLTIVHTAGDVAPVSKTVNYGTVVTNLTGANKCWITQNLGADNQAGSATDATEAAAGWYWQFNHKQGYKHDGTTRTPTTPLNPIDEASDWTAANDPCTILLGTGWRIPTLTEWTNANSNGGWGNYNDTYASVLKLHIAGAIRSDGVLVGKDWSGQYWSSMQNSNTTSWIFGFWNSGTQLADPQKVNGYSVRCIKD